MLVHQAQAFEVVGSDPFDLAQTIDELEAAMVGVLSPLGGAVHRVWLRSDVALKTAIMASDNLRELEMAEQSLLSAREHLDDRIAEVRMRRLQLGAA